MADTHIKIKPVTPRVQYTANGSTTVFPYSFAIFDETDMVVYVDDTIITTGYTVSGAGQTDGGNVTFDSAPVDGTIITLLRNVPIERITDFQEGGTFRPKNINDEFDRQTAFAQQVQEALSRCVKVDPTSESNPEEILPKIERLYASADNIDIVANDKANVDAVAGSKTNIDAVADDISNIDAVASELPDVKTKANKSLDNLDATGQAVIDGKVDLNAANLSTAGKSLISGLGMPSNRYTDLTLGASGATYTAPANGYVYLTKRATAVGQFINITQDVSTVSNFTCFSAATTSNDICRCYLPVKKGQVFAVGYSAAGTNATYFRFYYAEGEPNV